MKIHKQTIANGCEWKPCINCGHRFVIGEIITAISHRNGEVTYWYCSECFDAFWFAPLPAPVESDDRLCMIVIKDNKVTVPPKTMCPEDYMKRKREIFHHEGHEGHEERKIVNSK